MSRNIHLPPTEIAALLDKPLNEAITSAACADLVCCLNAAGLHTLGDVCSKTEDEIRQNTIIGEKGLEQLKPCINVLGLGFGIDMSIFDIIKTMLHDLESVCEQFKVKKDSGVHPHDIITTVSLNWKDYPFNPKPKTLDAIFQFFSDRDGREDEPKTVFLSVNGKDYKGTPLDEFLFEMAQSIRLNN